jgi:ketosteroid isomerase-like protein
MNKILLQVVLLAFYVCGFAQAQNSLADLLTKQFHQAWNEENVNKMVSLLQPDAFFKSTQQLRYGRDKMAATVLKTYPPKYKVASTKEIHSKVEDDIAWSIGEFTSDIYDEYGNKTKEQLKGTYTYVFTKKNIGDWKVQMLIYHDE